MASYRRTVIDNYFATFQFSSSISPFLLITICYFWIVSLWLWLKCYIAVIKRHTRIILKSFTKFPFAKNSTYKQKRHKLEQSMVNIRKFLQTWLEPVVNSWWNTSYTYLHLCKKGKRIRFLLKIYYIRQIKPRYWHPENESNLGIQFGFLLKFNLNVHIPT